MTKHRNDSLDALRDRARKETSDPTRYAPTFDGMRPYEQEEEDLFERLARKLPRAFPMTLAFVALFVAGNVAHML